MKNLLFLLLALTLFNCSDDDSNTDDVLTEDPLIGEWQRYKIFNYNDDTEEWDLEDVDENIFLDKYIFDADGTFTAQFFVMDELVSEEIQIWERQEDGMIYFIDTTQTYGFFAETFCSNNILKMLYSENHREYFRKANYDTSACDEIVYENE